MNKPKKTATKAAPAKTVSSDEKATRQTLLDDIPAAARMGVSEFLKVDPFKNEKWCECSHVALKRVLDVLPSVVKCLLMGIFAQQTGERPPNRDMENMVIKGMPSYDTWDEALGVIMFHAALGDAEFFQHLGKAHYEGRKPTYSPAQACLAWNWDEMQTQWPFKTDGFKFWRDEAVRSLLSELYYRGKDGGLDLSAYRSMRNRLGLRPERRKTVRFWKVSRDDKKKVIAIEVG